MNTPNLHPDPVALESAAMALYQSGDNDAAVAGFRELLALAPEHSTALQFLGFQAVQAQNFAEAAEFYRRASWVQPNDAATLFNLAMALFGLRDLDGALEAIDGTLARDPDFLQAQLYRGLILEQLQRPADAAAAFLRATRFAEARLDPRQIPTELKHFLNYALAAVRNRVDQEMESALAPLAHAHGDAAIERLRKAAAIFAGKIPPEFAHPKWRPGLFYVPDLPPRAFYERADFPWVARVEAATEMIREELLGVLGGGVGFAPYVDHPDGSHGAAVFKEINRSEDWSAFHFFRHGERIEANCARCPKTAELLASLDLNHVPGYGPEVMFSVLKAHSRIPAHYGAVNGRLVVHLPLIVPPDCGGLRVSEETRSWTTGELMFFDDTFEHEAWNHSDETRVVLIFDTWNPNLTAVEREAFCAVLAAAQAFERQALTPADQR